MKFDNTYNEVVMHIAEGRSKSDYTIYHKTYTSAMDAVLEFVKTNGYTVDDEEWFMEVTTGNGRPSEGKTTRHNLSLYKGEKETRRRVHVQVFGMTTQYELNMYIS